MSRIWYVWGLWFSTSLSPLVFKHRTADQFSPTFVHVHLFWEKVCHGCVLRKLKDVAGTASLVYSCHLKRCWHWTVLVPVEYSGYLSDCLFILNWHIRNGVRSGRRFEIHDNGRSVFCLWKFDSSPYVIICLNVNSECMVCVYFECL